MTTSVAETAILFLLIIGFFAWLGYRRGFIGELVKFGLILLAFAVGQKSMLGGTVIRVINGIWLIFQIVIHGGLGLLLSGDLSSENLSSVLGAAKEAGTLIPPTGGESFLFVLMILLIILAFFVGSKVKRKSSKLLGVFMGIVNGLALIYIFRPYLSGKPLLPPLDTSSPLQALASLFSTAFDLLLLPVDWLQNTLGVLFVPFLIVAIVLILLRSLRS
jgi:hypothetical protein